MMVCGIARAGVTCSELLRSEVTARAGLTVAMIELRIESKIVLEGPGGPVGVFDMVV